MLLYCMAGKNFGKDIKYARNVLFKNEAVLCLRTLLNDKLNLLKY